MKKIAVFGKPANGKSTLSRKLADATGIRLYAVDSILYYKNGQEIDSKYYEQIHNNILSSEHWILEGFGPMNSLDSFHRRLQAADTLIYIDLPYFTSYWLVTKRLMKGIFRKPEGWPKDSSIVKGTFQSYKILKHCPLFWNNKFLAKLEHLSADKTLYIIRSISELDSFIEKNVH